ncbi:MAG: lysophospholipid acyltransferase family protein [Planctomycetota bacterium]|nr:lysophospholipid acyltransferase family protein [Planctomycetota bacterium]
MARSRLSVMEPVGVGNEVAHGFIVDTLRFLFRTLFRVRLEQSRSLPDGPVIVAANHRSFLDPMVMGAVVDRRVFFVMSAFYYDKPILNRIYRLERCIPVEDSADNRTALRAGKSVLDADRVLGIFPEGRISVDGTLQEGQPGTAWLAAKTGAQVYPLWIGGTREVLPKGRWLPRFRQITAKMGDPLSMAKYPSGREGQRLFTEDLMAALKELGRDS